MIKLIRLLVEGFFDDNIFNVENDINSDIEDIGDQYYDYKIGDIYYINKNPYAICCGEPKYFNDNKPKFCLLEDSKDVLHWRIESKLVKELGCFKFEYFYLNSMNDFLHIDEDGYKNTQIIKNNYNISEFPAFKECIELGDNVYLPAIDELLMMLLNKNKLDKYSFSSYYWSSSLYSAISAYNIDIYREIVSFYYKSNSFRVRPFFHLK